MQCRKRVNTAGLTAMLRKARLQGCPLAGAGNFNSHYSQNRQAWLTVLKLSVEATWFAEQPFLLGAWNFGSCQAELPVGPLPVKTLAPSLQSSPLVGNTSHSLSQVAGGIEHTPCDSSRRGLWKRVPHFLWTLSHVLSPSANFALFCLFILNHSQEDNNTLQLLRSLRKSPSLGGVLGTLVTGALKFKL